MLTMSTNTTKAVITGSQHTKGFNMKNPLPIHDMRIFDYKGTLTDAAAFRNELLNDRDITLETLEGNLHRFTIIDNMLYYAEVTYDEALDSIEYKDSHITATLFLHQLLTDDIARDHDRNSEVYNIVLDRVKEVCAIPDVLDDPCRSILHYTAKEYELHDRFYDTCFRSSNDRSCFNNALKTVQNILTTLEDDNEVVIHTSTGNTHIITNIHKQYIHWHLINNCTTVSHSSVNPYDTIYDILIDIIAPQADTGEHADLVTAITPPHF